MTVAPSDGRVAGLDARVEAGRSLSVGGAGWSFTLTTALNGLADELVASGLWSDPVRVTDRSQDTVDDDAGCTVNVFARADRPGAWWDPVNRRVEVAVPWPDGLAMVKATLRQVVDRVGQERGLYRLHASAVEIRGRLVVLAGDSEAGKTATAVDAWTRLGARIVANDWLTIQASDDTARWHSGDSMINLRHGSLDRVAPELAREVFRVPLTQRRFERATRLPVSRLTGAEPGAAAGRVIDHLVLIRLDGGSPHLRVTRDDQPSAGSLEPSRRLFELLSSRLAGTAVLPAHDGGDVWPEFAVPSFDDDTLRQRRARFVDGLYRRGVLASVAGPLPLVRDWLDATGEP